MDNKVAINIISGVSNEVRYLENNWIYNLLNHLN